MSYNADPEWTKHYQAPRPESFTCPTCGKVAGNTERVMDILFSSDYYTPRHIPPTLIFTCDNVECPDCDNDFTYYLFVAIATARGPNE